MKKSTLIATCLFNSSMAASLELGEQIVRDVFELKKASRPGVLRLGCPAARHDRNVNH
jgi:hypothetical protein